MQFTARREDVLRPLQLVSGVVERRQTLPILSNVLIQATEGAVTLTATDLEVQLRGRFPATVSEPGSATLPARKFLDICRTLPDGADLQIQISGDRAALRSGRSRFTLATLPPDEFPEVAVGPDAVGFAMPQRELRELVTRTHFAMALQDVRYYLNGLLLELEAGLVRAVATDGHRLALGELPAPVEVPQRVQVIVPRKGIQELLRMLEDQEGPVEIAVGGNHIQLRLADVQLTSKLVDGRFPEYQRVIPRGGDKRVTADREGLRQALTRTSILSNEKYRGVRMLLSKGTMKLQAHNPDQEEAEEELEVAYTGSELEIGFNVTYLLDALAAIPTASVDLVLTDGNSSALIQADDKAGYRYVVMPMRL